MSEKYIVLFPPFKDKTSTFYDVSKNIKEWEINLKNNKLPFQFLSKFPRDLPDQVHELGRKGYLKYKNEWYSYRSKYSNSRGDWRLIGTKATKLPPFLMEVYMEAYGVELPELLLDPNPLVRVAAEKLYKRLKKTIDK